MNFLLIFSYLSIKSSRQSDCFGSVSLLLLLLIARGIRLSETLLARTMATTQEVKLFGKWTFDDVEVRTFTRSFCARDRRASAGGAMPAPLIQTF